MCEAIFVSSEHSHLLCVSICLFSLRLYYLGIFFLSIEGQLSKGDGWMKGETRSGFTSPHGWGRDLVDLEKGWETKGKMSKVVIVIRLS